MLHRVAFFVFALLGSVGAPLALEAPPTLGQLAGEALEFQVRWGVIPAATATLEVIDLGGGSFRLRATARGMSVIRAVYPLEDVIESDVDPALRVRQYRKKGREGWGEPHDDAITFDAKAGVARFTRRGQLKKTLPVPPGVQDPLSCFYAFRTSEVQDGRPTELQITDGKKVVSGTVLVLGRETITTPAGTFRTVLIEPKIEGLGGVFKKSPGARVEIWLTDDARRMPVKLRSKVVVGHFTAELKAVKR